MPSIFIVASSGPSDPTKASIPFHIAANGAAASGVDCGVAFAGDAAELLKPEVAATVRGVGIPPLTELLAACRERGVHFHV